MKLLLDENLSPRLVEMLSEVYPGSAHVHALGLGAADDGAIWTFAKEHGFAIVSKDADFAECSVLEEGPPKVVWLRLGNCTTSEIARSMRVHVEVISRFLGEDSETCLVLGS